MDYEVKNREDNRLGKKLDFPTVSESFQLPIKEKISHSVSSSGISRCSLLS
jgi:hypothetical protein